jgi:hypothetical protein
MMTYLPVSCITAGFFLFNEFSLIRHQGKCLMYSWMMRGHQLFTGARVGDHLRSPAPCASMSGVVSYHIGALTGSYLVFTPTKS